LFLVFERQLTYLISTHNRRSKMKKSLLLVMASLLTTLGCAEETAPTQPAPTAATNAPAAATNAPPGLPEFIRPVPSEAPPASVDLAGTVLVDHSRGGDAFGAN
jgi:hypothetical protein